MRRAPLRAVSSTQVALTSRANTRAGGSSSATRFPGLIAATTRATPGGSAGSGLCEATGARPQTGMREREPGGVRGRAGSRRGEGRGRRRSAARGRARASRRRVSSPATGWPSEAEVDADLVRAPGVRCARAASAAPSKALA